MPEQIGAANHSLYRLEGGVVQRDDSLARLVLAGANMDDALQEALLHPELGVGVEWRFVYFRADISEGAVNAATAIVWDLAFQGKPVSEQTANYLTGLRARLNDLFPQGHPLVKRHTGDTQSSV